MKLYLVIGVPVLFVCICDDLAPASGGHDLMLLNYSNSHLQKVQT